MAADRLSEEELKAAFVFNFTKYAKWPDNAFAKAGEPFRVGVSCDGPLSGHLSHMNGRVAHGHPIVVLNEPNHENWSRYHLLFIGNPMDPDEVEELRKISTRPILTVSDLPDFVRSGGIIGLKIVDKRVRFDVNLKSAATAGIEISSQLLKMAMEVIR